MKKILLKTLMPLLSLCFSYQVTGDSLPLELKTQEKYEDKWKNLVEGLSERQVISKLGKPKLIWRCSTDCYYFYEDIPKVSLKGNGSKVVRLKRPGQTNPLSDMMGAKEESSRGVVKFYYGVANPLVTLSLMGNGKVLPKNYKTRNHPTVRCNIYGGGHGQNADYYSREIRNPEKKIYRLEKASLPDFLSMRYREQKPTETWNKLSEFTNKQKWQDPMSWRKLPSKVNEKMSKGPKVWIKKPTINKQYFSDFTEEKIISLLGEPHIKINIPGNRIWQYGDVYDSYRSGGSRGYRGEGKKRSEPKDFIEANQTGFGRIVFVQDKRGIYVLSKWSEPYWPDVKESLSQTVNHVSLQQKEIVNKPSEETNPSETFPKWTIKDTWLKMKTGITPEQVTAILGKPEYIQSYHPISNSSGGEGSLVNYFYGLPIGANEELISMPCYNNLGNGLVTFQESGRKLFVKTWYEPNYDKIDNLINYKMRKIIPKRGREKWEKIESWKKLRPNMPSNSVERLLGSPHLYSAIFYTNKLGINYTAKWVYGDVKLGGILKFKVKTSKKGKIFVLSEWSEPCWLEVEKDVNGGSKYEVPNKAIKDDSIDIFKKKVENDPKNKLIIGNNKIYQITDNNDNDKLPCVGGSNIVWQGTPEKFSSILLYNNEGVKTISKWGNHYFPKISGNNIVWEGQSRLILYKNGKIIRLSKSKPYSYDISGGRVIWEDDSGVNYYDGIQKRHLHVGNYPYNPAISETEIAWSDGNCDHLFMTKRGKVEEILLGSYVNGKASHLRALKISGENIILQGNDYSLHYIDSKKPVTRAPGYFGDISPFRSIPESQNINSRNYEVSTKFVTNYNINGKYGPSINNSSTVWIGDTYDLFLFDGNETMRITNNLNKNLYPKINENNIIVWQGHDGNDYEIFVYDGKVITQITNNEFDDLRPSLSENTIAWQGWDGNDYEIFMVNLQ